MKSAFALLLAAVVFSGCAHKKHVKLIPQPSPPPSQPSTPPVPNAPSPPAASGTRPAAPQEPAPAPKTGYQETGLASWYGHPYHGRPAANGEIYDMEKMVAAHRTLPFDTWVRVYNLDNDKTVEVRIIDRGPFVDGRIIDLSHAAARAIAMIGPGIAHVRMEVIRVPEGVPAAIYVVQVGAFQDRATAERVRAQMAARYGRARVMERKENPGVWRVQVGDEPTLEGANKLAARIRRESGEKKAFAVRLDSQ
jgi:rare lipoprotein A